MVNTIKRLLQPLQRRVMLMVGRCVIRLVDDSLKLQGVQVVLLEGEIRTAERMQEFGFTSVPLAGCEGIAVAVCGNRDHLVVVATDDAGRRPTGLETGESCMYDAEDQRIHLKKGKLCHLYGSKEFRLEAESINLGGEQGVLALIDERILVLLNSHTHIVPGVGPTTPPVQPVLSQQVCTQVTKAK